MNKILQNDPKAKTPREGRHKHRIRLYQQSITKIRIMVQGLHRRDVIAKSIMPYRAGSKNSSADARSRDRQAGMSGIWRSVDSFTGRLLVYLLCVRFWQRV
ncbi:hypothetical protein BaRGS_00019539 [Batillaria attramentaria]|uniref:Uncharacterized protein n=1 Tax=Batillaria attramentaria TaxID=370345 RepID=A0ABD0KPK1_9CAEN